jgi:ABC-2 type transport system ATP-binding protein
MTWGVDGLSVTYGDTRALIDVTLRCGPGDVVAVVGGDGAGKSTLLRALAGVGVPHTGTLDLPGPGDTGYVPADGGIYQDLTIDEHLDFVSSAFGLTGWETRASELLERTGLFGIGDRLAGQLSGGQRRKLAGAMALLPHPRLLVLDEVTTGVDPVSRMDLWRLIGRAAAEGAAVVFATSYLDEAERAGFVVLLHEGRVIAAGSSGDVIASMPGTVDDTDQAGTTDRSWRRGRRWRNWDPNGVPTDHPAARLEDAAIVAELMSIEVAQP